MALDNLFTAMFDEHDSKEYIALRLIWLRKPVLLLAAALFIYGTFGVPALRLDYKYYGSGEYKTVTWARCITLKGFQEFNGHVPVFFFVKDGRVTFPKS